MTIPELEALEAKMLAVMEQERQAKAIAARGRSGTEANRSELKEEDPKPLRNWRD